MGYSRRAHRHTHPEGELRRITEIAPPYTIDFYALPEDGIAPWKEALDRWGKDYAREPGVLVRRAVAHEDGVSSLFEITFWKQFKTYATVSEQDEEDLSGC